MYLHTGFSRGGWLHSNTSIHLTAPFFLIGEIKKKKKERNNTAKGYVFLF